MCLDVPLLGFCENKFVGKLRNIPLSKLPSPNSAEEIFVFEKKAPILAPLLKTLEVSIVSPKS